jgi:hypothetical protein
MGIVAVIFFSFEIESKTFNAGINSCDAVDAAGNAIDAWTVDLNPDGSTKYVKLSMGWVYVFMGNMIGSAVVPVAMAITWKDCNAFGAIAGAWLGLIGALVSWMVCANNMYCDVNYWSLFKDEPLLVGNLVAILLSGLIALVCGLIAPQNYDWSLMNKHVTLVEEVKADVPEWELEKEFLDKALSWSLKYGVGTTIFLVIIWPVFIAHPMGVFPKAVYTLWVSVAFVWGWVGMLVIVFLPLWENADLIVSVATCKCKKPDEDVTMSATASSTEARQSEKVQQSAA